VTETNVLNHPIYSGRSKMILYAAAAFSLIAALIHLWVIPEHLEEWWGYGAFFLISAVAQGAYSGALLRWPRRPLLLLGIGGNVSIIVLYLLTRTVGIPFFGPHAGEVEGVGVADLCATTSELALVVALLGVLLRDLPRERVVIILFVMALVGLLVGHLLHLMLSLTPAH
jgi:manganese oxidase